ncbi:MAG: hypothetical protein OEM48_10080 [Gammaproteobacteria bacterium]|nr:hypothetical protein [Gammaproteobacteria bacterium]MDH3371241.1 hypothetical protein [Gammaproteobacteria bacterium]MDH3407250.1 hypothetical protein [Gammaproteobacteria bacterium]MDH5488247.1 hypothetical protein [Gammaproteobacteria bacterium]
MEKEKLVLVGNGMAGIRTLEELIKMAPNMPERLEFREQPRKIVRFMSRTGS